MNKQALQLIIKSRSKLMRGQVGMASMLLHLEPVEVTPTQWRFVVEGLQQHVGRIYLRDPH